MSLAYSGYESAVVGVAIDMLAASGSWRAAVGATTSTAAKARIVEGDGGAAGDVPRGSMINCLGDLVAIAGVRAMVTSSGIESDDSQAIGHVAHRGSVEILIVVPPTPGDAPPERMRRARNLCGLIRDEMQAAVGGPGAFAHAHIDLSAAEIIDDAPAVRDVVATTITIHWRTP